MKNNLLSIIVPCYNEEGVLPIFFETAQKECEQLTSVSIEYIFVNDSLKDKTLTILRNLSNTYPNTVNYISFSRNFGKEAALYAGLQHAKGKYIAVMDADLQGPPSLLPKMLDTLQNTNEEIDCVATRRSSREGELYIRSLFVRQFYRLINRISDTEIVDGARDFQMMTRQMVDAILSVTEYNRFSKGIFSWVGFNTYYLEYENIERAAGQISWSFWQLFKYSIDGIVAYSGIPLSIASFVGFSSFLFSLVFALFIIIRTIIFKDPTSGWPSLVCLILTIGGIQLFCLGILGKYLGKMFLETKKRPLFIIKEENDPSN
ncbi:Glycosyltransferase involved in cell wall bisynthesis [Carnobacterium iners]|uniref:Glycosyltransferase involved in cell wall bisynthesis n=1 Tax=Carnobacterium iners TaxID=1073423 RepID=A0A1X7MSQ9_9LACT|nr:glycosyltransferase family 2 protein [Carnobacterium iners]SEL30498.1 Glycosyltransferase involved in cell wall bisynthesis [Carnobacterium iners]SMH26983.1 Glycosyltransferase involved in cell wall bisynthesis [Carnobacterium iners]